MRLTPADVHNVAFKKPSIGKRGYDEDEVDQFLDLVEDELSKLIEENNELTQRVAAYESGGQVPTPDTQPLHDEIQRLQQENAGLSERAVSAEQAAEEARAAAEQARQELAAVPQAPSEASVDAQPSVTETVPQPAASGEAVHVQAARLLGLAQETADRLTAEAAAEAEQVRSSARTESETLLNDARTESDRVLTEARTNAENMTNEATATAEATDRDSRIKAEAMDREAQRKYTETMDQLNEQRATLEGKIDDLRTYEREYRSRLKEWISGQLAGLDIAEEPQQQPEPEPAQG